MNCLGDQRLTQNKIVENYGEDSIQIFAGPKGLNFIEDTSNYHSGSIPKRGRRILITLLFIDNDSAKYKSSLIARKYLEESLIPNMPISQNESYICFNLLNDQIYNEKGEKISIFNSSIN